MKSTLQQQIEDQDLPGRYLTLTADMLRGALALKRNGQVADLPCLVDTIHGKIEARLLYSDGGGVYIERTSDGRRSNYPVPYAEIALDRELAERALAETARRDEQREAARAWANAQRYRRGSCGSHFGRYSGRAR